MKGMSLWGSVPNSGPDPSSASSRAPIYLNIYDLTPMNGYVYWFGLGIFHSGIEAHGVEYAFGAHEFPTSGVFEVEPRSCPGFIYRTTVLLGTTDLDPSEFRTFVEQCADDYNGDTYHLIAKNCNHFSNDMCLRLTGNAIPGWVNRLARIGWFCNCLLPESLQVTAVTHSPECQGYEEHDGDLGCEKEVVDTDSDQDRHLLSIPNGDSQNQMRDLMKM